MTTCITVMGTGLALRGPDGSMVRAVEGMYKQRAIVFRPGVRFEMIQVMYLYSSNYTIYGYSKSYIDLYCIL